MEANMLPITLVTRKGLQDKVKSRFADQTNKIKEDFPMKKDAEITLYLGGILMSMCIWSGHASAAIISTPFC